MIAAIVVMFLMASLRTINKLRRSSYTNPKSLMKTVRKSKRKSQSSRKVRKSHGTAMSSVLRSSQNLLFFLMLMTMPL
jgi:hypothetical protein